MKNLITTLISIFFSISTINAQWTELNSGTTVHLNGIQFVDEHYGYCIGNDGIFLYTIDGGINWTKKTFFTTENFQELHFVNNSIGFISSDKHIYKTSDGGANFTEITYLLQHPDTPSKIMDNISISFTDSIGIISAFWNDTVISLKSNNSGLTWDDFSSALNTDVQYSIIDMNVIYGVFLNRTKQYKTIDGGDTWTLVRNLPYTTVKDGGFKVFNTNGLGYASCEYAQPFVSFFSDYSDTMVDNGFYPPESYSFIDTAVGYYLWKNKLHTTTDRGITNSMIYEFSDTLNHIFFLNELLGFVCGKNGKIYKTEVGGTTSIENTKLKKKIKIYPNPTSEKIHLDYGNDLQIQKIQLVNISGRVAKTFGNNEKVLNVNGVSSGVYLLNIQAKGGMVSEKIVIE
jgi:photosystem II stability/assembly factor-like uncharacterized protein